MEAEIKTLDYQVHEIMEKIILNTNNYSSDWTDDPQYKKITRLKNEKSNLLAELTEKECFLKENKAITIAVKSYLHNRSEVNPSLMSMMFTNEIFIYPNEIDIEVTWFDYLKELKTEFIYTGDGIAWT